MSGVENAPRKRGRPAQLSREQIVEAALDLLRIKPRQSLTMQALARQLGAAPMSLYTHVRNRQDLMQAIADNVLRQVQFTVDEQDWQATVYNWAHAVRRQFLAYPFLASLMQDGLGTPAAWLELSNPLLQALRQAGLRGEQLADAQRWVSRVVTGSVLMELMLPAVVPAELTEVQKALADLPERSRSTWLEILPALGTRSDDGVFDYTLARTLDAVQALAKTKAARPQI